MANIWRRICILVIDYGAGWLFKMCFVCFPRGKYLIDCDTGWLFERYLFFVLCFFRGHYLGENKYFWQLVVMLCDCLKL